MGASIDDPRSQLAIRLFPREWAKANAKIRGASKARNNLRKRAEYHVQREALRATGAACATCRYFSPWPGPGPKGRMICDVGSDFHGYQEAKPDGLCLSYSAVSP